jgi:hypothetical protein
MFLHNFHLILIHDEKKALNLFFCYRWLLIIFKREFSFADIQKLWDVLWSQYLTTNFHLFMAASILVKNRKQIMAEQMEFDDMLKVLFCEK